MSKPKTVKEAVDLLVKELPIGCGEGFRTGEFESSELHHTVGRAIPEWVRVVAGQSITAT